MGNQIAGLAPSQLIHVEQCLQELTGYKYEKELGSSRFFKVAKVNSKDGNRICVVKVFVIPEASIPIQDYKFKVDVYCLKKNNAHNILPYIETRITDKAAILVREYVDHSLYDRISTRPFLTIDEKKWIAFQLLCALVQIHKEPVDNHSKSAHYMCHGDIKSENVLLTSWGWLYLADMAPFKPVCLPADNPSEFGFFFDAYSRKAGYLAPERFIEPQKVVGASSSASSNSCSSSSKSSTTNSEPLRTDALGEVKAHDPDWTSSGWTYNPDLSVSGDATHGIDGSQLFLKPSMDIFSAGCVLLELFTDGTTPFSLSQLLSYRGGDSSRLDLLEKVPDVDIREMIRRMISLNELERISAEECLFMQRGKAFPEFFYKYLNIYMQNFLHQSMMNADVRVCTIQRDLPSIIERQAGDPSGASPKNGSLVIQLNVITASIKCLSSEYSKLKALSALLELARFLTSDIVLDRIVPHMLEFLSQANTHSSEVRRYAVECVICCVYRVKDVHSSDLNFFPEYLIPALSHLNTDPQEEVRIAFAENLAMLAETALRFLNEAQCLLMVSGDVEEKPTLASYDTELNMIRHLMRDIVMHCLSDPSNRVKESLVNIQSLTRLANFFGKSKANEILLSHLITFLNDKTDFNLRLSFFNELAPLALILGSQCTPVLRSLLEQGLVDPEESVVESCLVALSNLADWGLLSAGLMAHFVHRIVPLLSHPSERLRSGALIYLVTFSNRASEAAVFVQLICNDTVHSYFQEPITSFNNEKVILSALGKAIPRPVFDSAVRSNQLESILDLLEERKYIRSITRSEYQPNYNAIDERIIQQFRKLQALGMTPEFEDKLLELKLLLTNIRKSRSGTFPSIAITPKPLNPNNLPSSTATNVTNSDCLPEPLQMVIPLGNGSYHGGNTVMGNKSPNPESERNKEWQEMFMSNKSNAGITANPPSVTSPDIPAIITKPSQSPSSLKAVQPKSGSTLVNDRQNTSRPNFSNTSIDRMKEVKSNVTLRRSPHEVHQSSKIVPTADECVKRFEYLMKDRLTSGALRLPEMSDSFQWVQGQQIEADWKPKGILVAHLHEHLMGDVYLLAHPCGKQLVSCGGDGLLKFWNCGIAGQSDSTSNRLLPNKSQLTYSVTSHDNTLKPFKNLVWADNNQAVATVYDSNSIHVLNLDGKQRSVLNLQTDVVGRCVQMTAPRATLGRMGDSPGYESPLVVYTTTNGNIIAHDLRSPPTSPHFAWNLSQNKTHGMLLSLVVRDCHTWLVTGSSRGRLVCWDLRYQRPLSHAEHPLKASFHRLALHPMTVASSHAGLDMTNSSSLVRADHTSSMAPQILAACDKNNEVSSWDLETCTRVSTLWASHVPLLSSTTASRHSVKAFLVNNLCNSSSLNSIATPSMSSLNQSSPRHNSISIITGSTDFRLRFWDLSCPSNSSMIALRGNEEHMTSSVSIQYRSQVVEGTEVLIEEMPSAEENCVSGPNTLRSPTKGHVNIISDLAILESKQPFLVSASVDGVIKFWK